MKEILRKGFIYYLLSSLFIGVLFLCYMKGDTVMERIDLWGWLFFVTSCLSHAALLVLALFLIFYLPWALLRLRRVATGLFVTSVVLLAMVVFLNMQVYHIYRFHINGFILNMLTGPSAGDIFQFDGTLVLTESLLLLLVAAVSAALWWAACWISKRWQHRYGYCSVALLVGSLLVANGLHVYGSFVVKPSILLPSRLVPYYFPLSMSSLLEDMGFERHTDDTSDGMSGDGELQYPLHELRVEPPSQKTSVVFILIDSWNRRALTEECMPRLAEIAANEQYYMNHMSCSNGTRYSVFGLFTGLQPYYWPVFQGSHQSPLLVDQLLSQGYQFRAYPSATLQSPPFSRVLFQHVPDLRTKTPGLTPYERDHRLTSHFIADLSSMAATGEPFFAFLFYDMPHSLIWPEDQPKHFTPAWDYADYAALNVNTPVEPFWNLYRNLCHATDSLVGQVVDALKRYRLYDRTLLVVTGDHGQEFNENHNNYWGHSSNFSVHQVGVPLIMHQPGKPAARHRYRTTHYDIVPTLMHDYLGVLNPPSDYSAGRLLNDSTPRRWQFVGNELRYAFLLEKDTILTKEGAGWIDVTDARMNPVSNYHIHPQQFEQAVKELNRFFK